MATATAEKVTGYENATFDLRTVPIEDIVVGEIALRGVDRNSEEYMRFRDSVAMSNGPWLPILLQDLGRRGHDGRDKYGLIDGLQRYSSCMDLGFHTIPARVIPKDAADVAKAQIIANRSRIETTPVEFTKQLVRILRADPTLTKEELANDLCVDKQWLEDRLSLAKLHEELQPLVDTGKIPLAHAFALVKLQPQEEQLDFKLKSRISQNSVAILTGEPKLCEMLGEPDEKMLISRGSQ